MTIDWTPLDSCRCPYCNYYRHSAPYFTTATIYQTPYQPKHRKPGPAQ